MFSLTSDPCVSPAVGDASIGLNVSIDITSFTCCRHVLLLATINRFPPPNQGEGQKSKYDLHEESQGVVSKVSLLSFTT